MSRVVKCPPVRTEDEAKDWASILAKLPQVAKVEVVRRPTGHRRWVVVLTLAPSRFADWEEGSLEEVNDEDDERREP